MHEITKALLKKSRECKKGTRNDTIVKLAMKYSYVQLLQQLNSAIDREDMERVNLLIDTIQADHKSRRLMAILPPGILKELSDYAPRKRNKDNDSNHDRPA